MAAKHTFALYVDKLYERVLHEPVAGVHVVLTERSLVHRICDVLRLESNDRVVLFDEQRHYDAEIVHCSKRAVRVMLLASTPLAPLQPSITTIVPLVKRDAFEQVLYAATELGVTSIQPVITRKSLRAYGSPKELHRAQMIMRAAAEQAKQYVLPTIGAAVPLAEYGVPPSTVKLVADPCGVPMQSWIASLKGANNIVCCMGPEGDFTDEEKEWLKAQGFQSCALTPTVLRAQQAYSLLVGIVRATCMLNS